MHPSANPVENLMSKTMKIALKTFLSNYHNTPHPATDITPSAMLFQDPPQSVFPQRGVSEKDINIAKSQDVTTKQLHEADHQFFNSIQFNSI